MASSGPGAGEGLGLPGPRKLLGFFFFFLIVLIHNWLNSRIWRADCLHIIYRS